MRVAIYPPPRFASRLAAWLIERGFLKRDARLYRGRAREAGYYINFLWQWRFWRGPYQDCLEAEERHRLERERLR
jgi:hypothetical protein